MPINCPFQLHMLTNWKSFVCLFCFHSGLVSGGWLSILLGEGHGFGTHGKCVCLELLFYSWYSPHSFGANCFSRLFSDDIYILDHLGMFFPPGFIALAAFCSFERQALGLWRCLDLALAGSL